MTALEDQLHGSPCPKCQSPIRERGDGEERYWECEGSDQHQWDWHALDDFQGRITGTPGIKLRPRKT